MRLGRMMNKALFALSFLAIFGLMAVNAPGAKSQMGYLQRMTLMHQNPLLHFSLLDTLLSPNPGAPAVGKFLTASAQSSQLIEGHPYPGSVNPEFLYGMTKDGTTIRRVGVTGTPLQTTDLSDTFSRMTGATLVTTSVPSAPFNTVPGCYDLKTHYVITGEFNQANPQLLGNSTGFMLLDPSTMQGFKVGSTNRFVGDSSDTVYEDVAFGAYPGLDGNYNTINDNEYRYCVFFTINGLNSGGMGMLCLNELETTNGTLGQPDPWNPIEATRGPDFPNCYPKVDANSKWGVQTWVVENNEQQFLKSYFLRPGLPVIGATPNISYVIATNVQQVSIIPPLWQVFARGLNIGTDSSTAPIVNTQAVSGAYSTSDINKSLTVVGDWGFCSVGPGVGGDGFADVITCMFIPEFVDGAADGDSGIRGTYKPTTSSMGYGGFFPSITNEALITYAGTGSGSSTVYGTLRSAYLDWAPNIFSAGSGGTPIDCHTDEEKLLGLNIRRAPQPFTGYYQSVDPADIFPGATGGNGAGPGAPGGCSGSATSSYDGAIALLGLIGMAFLLTKTLRS